MNNKQRLAVAYIDYSPGAEGGPVCNFMSPNFDSWSL